MQSHYARHGVLGTLDGHCLNRRRTRARRLASRPRTRDRGFLRTGHSLGSCVPLRHAPSSAKRRGACGWDRSSLDRVTRPCLSPPRCRGCCCGPGRWQGQGDHPQHTPHVALQCSPGGLSGTRLEPGALGLAGGKGAGGKGWPEGRGPVKGDGADELRRRPKQALPGAAPE